MLAVFDDKKLFVSSEKAYRIEATFEDFDGDLNGWKDSFYQMWRWQMTYDYAYSMKVDDRRSGVYFCAVVKPAYKDQVVEAMEAYGYREIKSEECLVASVDGYGFEEAFGDFAEAAIADL